MSEPTVKPTAAPDGKPESKHDSKHDEAAPSKASIAKDKAKNALGKIKGFASGMISGMKGGISGFFMMPAQVFKSIVHGDFMTKVLSLGFLASVVLVAMTGVQLFERFGPKLPKLGGSSGDHDSMKAFLENQKALTIAAANTVYLERFVGTLKSGTSGTRKFEVELYIESAEPEAARFIKAHTEAFRERVSNVLLDGDYDKLLTEEGKETLRKKIAASINLKLKSEKISGEVKKVFFTKFVMS